MKRVLAWLLLIVMVFGLFAGCKKQVVEEEVSTAVSAKEAMEYLKALYPNPKQPQLTPKDYTRYGVIRVGGEEFKVVWTTDAAESDVKIETTDGEDIKINVNEQSEKEVAYSLTATITDRAGDSASHKWDFILPVAMSTEEILKAAYALADGESLPYEVTLTGKITTINQMYDPDYKNITVTIVCEGFEDYPLECYRMKGEGIENLQPGNIITVTGTIKNYKGKIEFDSGCIMESWEKGDAIDPPADPVEIVKAAYALEDGEVLPYIATLTGKVTGIDNPFDPTYNNITVIMTVEGAEDMPITCYRLKGTGVDMIALEDTITVKGIIKNYKGKIEFDSGCRLMERISGGNEVQQPSSDPEKIFGDALKLKYGQKLPYYATLTGKVTEIDTPYDKNYGNISVVIKVEGYEKYPLLCYRLKSGDADASKIAKGDTITVKGIIENYKGSLQFGSGSTLMERISGGGVAKPESSNASQILADAKKLGVGKKLDYYANLTGKVTKIDSPYDKNYGNISVEVNFSGTTMLCYRLKSGAADVSKIAVGDTITVRGVIENYKGSLQFGSGSTLEKRVSGGGVAKPESSNASQILADAAKLKEGEALSYYANLTGKVTKIDTPYDKEYKNISVYATFNGTTMLCYRLKSGAADVSKIAVGDTITVRGVIKNYKGAIQFDTGSTLTKRVSGGGVAKPESSNASQILADAAKLKEGEALTYYANLTGKVTAIDTPYDKEYKNISVYATFNGTSMLCYRLKSGAADVSKIAVGDTITVRGVIKNYKGAIQFDTGSTLTKRVSGGGTAQAESSDAAKILNDAMKLGTGEKLGYYANLTGKVTEIDTPYDKNYGNISVMMQVTANGKTVSLLCYRLKSGAADASKIAVGDTITVRGVIENYKGDIQFGTGSTLEKRVSGGGTVQAETSDQAKILADAAKLGSGEKLGYYSTLTGKVIKMESPYDKEYGNITVVMELNDANKTQITCFRMKSGAYDASKVVVGDTITVRGVLENYKGQKLEYGVGCTLEKRVSGGGVAKPETDNLNTIWTDAKALADGESLQYYATITGKVTKVKEAYSAEYGNISVYIDLSNGENILIYRMKSGAADASKIRVGDTITVRGVMTNYKGDVQMAQGGTLQKLEPGYNPGDNMTAKEILTAAYALPSASAPEEKKFLEGQYTLTGVITSVDKAYDSNYKNITVTFVVEGCEDMPIQAYRLAKGAADVSGLRVGDTITVTGQITKYNNKVQFDQGCVLDKVVKGEGGNSDVDIPAGSPVIHLDNSANRVELSTQQQVWKENGITVTNVKGSSDIADYVPARFYKGSTVTVEYPGMTRIVFYMDTFKSDYADQLVASLASVEGIVVTQNDRYVTVDLYTAVDSFTVPALVNQIRVLEITVCTGTTPPEGGNQGGNTGNLVPQMVTAPEANTAYKLYLKQETLGKTLYFAGAPISEQYSYYMKTTEDHNEATDVFVEIVDGGYRLYFMDGATKTYFDMYQDGTHYSLRLTATPTTVFTFNTQYNTFTAYVVDTDCYMGTYSTNDTISCSKISYISTSFVSHLGVMVEGDNSGSGNQGGNQGGSEGGNIEIPADAVIIDFGDVANRTSYSTAQQVWQQNGITVTNDKAGSSNDVYENTSSHQYARFYQNSKLTIAYPGMTRLVITHTAPYNGKSYSDGLVKALEGRDDVVITQNEDVVQIDFTSPVDELVVESLNYQIRVYEMAIATGTTPPEGGSQGGNQGGSEGGNTPSTPGTAITELEEGKAYNIMMVQGNANKTLYMAGGLNGEYWATTTDAASAKEIYVEVSGEGYHFYYTDGNGTKTYIEAYLNDSGKPRPQASATATQVWTYDAELGLFVVNMDDQDYYMGTYNTYETISVSSTYWITGSNAANLGISQFYTVFVEPGTGSGGNEGGNEGGSTNPPAADNDYVDAPKQDVAYKFGVYLPPLSNQNYYVDGTNGEKYLNTTTDVAQAVDVYYTANGSGYSLYTIKDGTKYFIDILPREDDNTTVRVVYKTADAQNPTIYQMNTEYKYLTTTVNGVEYTLGTYTNSKDGVTYETLSASKSSYLSDTSVIGVTQFPAWFMTADGNGSGNQGGNEGGSTTPDVPVTPPASSGEYKKVTSVDEILAGGKFVIGVYRDGSYYFMEDVASSSKIVEVSNITVTNDTITGTDLPVWTIASMSANTVSLYSTSYLNNPSKGNLAMSDTAVAWTLSEKDDTDTFLLQSTTVANRSLAHSDSASAFKSYADSNMSDANYTFYLVLFKAV